MAYSNHVVSLDIGSSSIIAMLGESNEKNQLRVLATAKEQSSGIRKGLVVNIEESIGYILSAIGKLEAETEHEIKNLIVNLGGKHIEGINSRGVVPITGKNREVSEDDIRNVISTAQAMSIPVDREIIHVIPRHFTVDQQQDVKKPLNVMGVRLEVEIHLIIASVVAGQNLVQCVNRAGFKVADVAFGTYAASLAVLQPDEREQGVLLLNIGKEITELIFFQEGTPVFSTSIVIGGDDISSDLSTVLNVSWEEAERVKKEYGVAHSSLVLDGAEPVIVERSGNFGPIACEQQEIGEIIQARAAEMLMTVKNRLHQKNILKMLKAGVVLTGGVAMLPGISELAQDVFRVPARVGFPANFEGTKKEYQTPDYSVATGLLIYGLQDTMHMVRDERPDRLKDNIKNWIKNFF